MFICGSMEMLAAKSSTWKLIHEKLESRGEIGSQLSLMCQNHGSETLVENDKDFLKVPQGGCNILCDTSLACGHKCSLVCHIVDNNHTDFKCRKPCEKRCEYGHKCPRLCFQHCLSCSVVVVRSLLCGHDSSMKCSQLIEDVECYTPVNRQLPCGHEAEMACFLNPAEYTCKIQVDKVLRCGAHKKTINCYVNADEVDCKSMVTKILPCGHEQLAECRFDPTKIKCDTMLEKELECGHMVSSAHFFTGYETFNQYSL